MGQCSQARLFYGFELTGADLVAFCSALRSHNEDNLDGRDTSRELKPSDIALVDLRDEIDQWLQEASSPFSVECNFDENASKDDDAEIALYYSGGEGIHSVEKWGYHASGSTWGGIGEPWTDENFLEGAKEAFKKLQEDPVMKAANIIIELGWFIGISIG